MHNRYVRDGAIESERVNRLGWQAEVFWRRLINRVDDFGRYTAHPELLRAKIFPMQLNKVSASDVSKLLLECEQAGLIGTWKGERDGKPYLVMAIWEKGRAKDSHYPEPPADVYKRLQAFVNVPDSDPDPDPDNPTLKHPSAREIPTLDESLAFGKATHPPYPEEMVREWFAHRNSQNWEKTSGVPITNWRSDLDAWCLKNLRERKDGRHKGRSAESNRNVGTANEGRSSQYAGVGRVQ